MNLRRVVRFCAWTIASGVFLVIALYGILVAINWSDEAPSADAVRLQRIVSERAPLADRDNAFVLSLGLLAPQDKDAYQWGLARKAFMEHFVSPASGAYVPMPGKEVDYMASRSAATKALDEACRRGDAGCLRLLEQDPARLDAWLASEGWLLARYRNLLACKGWRETLPNASNAPFATYNGAMTGQMLFLMQALQKARAGDAATARAMLQQDLVYWRMVLRSSDLLISKMIAAAAVERHFVLGNLVLRELQHAGKTVAAPDAWTRPISRDERSMQRALAGEWTYWKVSMPKQPSDGSLPAPVQWLVFRLMRPTYQPQATNNLYATFLLDQAKDVDVDFRMLPQAVRAASPDMASTHFFRAYNTMGNILYLIMATNDFTGYAVRVSDLEGVRRAALLAVDMRSDASDASTPLRRIEASAWRNPYTDRAFQWEPQTQGVVFEGLSGGERGHQTVLF